MSNFGFGGSGENREPGRRFREGAFFKFAKPYFDYLRRGKVYSLFYWAMAVFNLLIPLVVIFFVIESGFLRYSGAGMVVAFIFGWLIVVFSSWIGFQLWWNRETGLRRFEGADFIASPVVSDIVQTFGEWLGTFFGITGAGFGFIGLLFLKDTAEMFARSGYGFLRFAPFLIVLGPVIGFFTVLSFRFAAEQIRIFIAIANSAKEIARNSKK